MEQIKDNQEDAGMSIRDRILTILQEYHDAYMEIPMPGMGERCADSILAAVVESLPTFEPAHTYASENADIYRAYDNGVKACLTEIKSLLSGKE